MLVLSALEKAPNANPHIPTLLLFKLATSCRTLWCGVLVFLVIYEFIRSSTAIPTEKFECKLVTAVDNGKIETKSADTTICDMKFSKGLVAPSWPTISWRESRRKNKSVL